MSNVVSNTSPLQYLFQLDALDILQTGMVSALEPLVTRLQSLGFYLDPHTRAAVLELAGEKNRT